MPTPFVPVFTPAQARENHDRLLQRREVFRRKGIDLAASRHRLLTAAPPYEPPILEIGTGNGHLAIALAAAGHAFVSVDPDAEALTRAAMNLAAEGFAANATLYCMDASVMPFPKESFGTLFCVDAFHHMPDPAPILASMDRVLCPGGRLVLSDFNADGLAIVAGIHREEGRVHENHGMRSEWVADRLRRLGYAVTDHPAPHHWILVGVKPMGPLFPPFPFN